MSDMRIDAPRPAMSAPSGVGPYTGKEYLESLDDGREVWIYGERVGNVAEHPAFRNAARMTARIYDALHDPSKRDLMTIPIDNNPEIRTHRFFQAPRSVEEQVASRDAIAEWARMTYGWMGRTPDYKAAWVGTLACNSGLYGEYQANADRWYDYARQRVPYINHAIVHPPVDRNIANEDSDVFVRVERETDAGLIVSGAKVVATGAALTHYTFVAHYNVVHNLKKFSPIFMVRTNAPGVKIICRGSYEYVSGATGSPFDHPLSSRMDENDSILIFDKVLIPWEDVLMYGAEMSNKFISQSGFLGRTLLHGCTRLAVKLDFICGLFLKAVEITGTKDFRGVQAAVGEALGLRHVMWGLSDAMARSAEPWVGGYVLPNVESALAYRTVAADSYSRIKSLIGKIVASGLVYLPSTSQDFLNPELRPYLDKYVRGSNGIGSLERVKTLKLLWDAIGSEFGTRHELYELNYSGSYEQQKVDPLLVANATGRAAELKAFADRCMAEYDERGWVAPDLVNNDDFHVFPKR
ncbi:4-hydroxyphenylacetate 3-hydroxylase family protein [Rhizorhabdus dicambivorans]|uniref:Pyoverdin chromophore biosynthetic protein pvcC n=1 Tax=Rhizorhabdus dicambivorans TaxID=1850238 RepID=A0A2A4FWT6_9SPHN|nr:4-hydroxyphenylacetate 3-hydroxylase N-terminal domain-containing protein [Rhizorhabdus dicambivorans]ATE65508.1 Pyoverdin chromophore biosynthetic protein pvcC [Rhizorhabdus dicambivorans]PCE41851.1 Pyoverdin chromophore biosynthetic protein pvcC [Rhizorhabdus dicambivorans]